VHNGRVPDVGERARVLELPARMTRFEARPHKPDFGMEGRFPLEAGVRGMKKTKRGRLRL